jgi:hypothetical protein
VITYKLEKENLIRVDFEGQIVYNDISNWLNTFSKIPDLPPCMNFVYDLRKAVLLIDMIKLIQIAKKTEEVTNKYEKVRTVFLINESDVSTYSMLFSFLDVNGKTFRKVFTNEEKGMHWLLFEGSVTS